MKVRDVMTERVYAVTPDIPSKLAATRMLEYGVSGLPVVDGDQLVGIVTRANLVRAFARDDAEIAREIRRGGMLQRLRLDPERISVEVEHGNVVLGGEVNTADLAQSIVEFAERTPGVVSVESRLTCTPA
jgi:CBS-domain-containing membrane protein